jgi:hypothetical protein
MKQNIYGSFWHIKNQDDWSLHLSKLQESFVSFFYKFDSLKVIKNNCSEKKEPGTFSQIYSSSHEMKDVQSETRGCGHFGKCKH